MPPQGTPVAARRSIWGLGGSKQALPQTTLPSTPTLSRAATALDVNAPVSLIGASLEELAQTGRSSVPTVLLECFAWIRASGALDRPGLFRGTGDTDRMARIVAAFEQQPREPHRVLEKAEPPDEDVCSVIKLFLRSLKEPVLTFALFDEWVAASEGPAETLAALLARLPVMHREVAAAVMAFLRELTVHGASNGLTAQALAAVFGPVLLRPPLTVSDFERHRPAAVRLVQSMLDSYAVLFLHSSSSETTATSTATECTPRHSVQRRVDATLDEFSSLAKLVAGSSVTASGVPAAPAKTPDDSEEDMPESSSDEEDDDSSASAAPLAASSAAPRPAIMGRATVRVRQEAPSGEKLSSAEVSLTEVDTRLLQEHINQLREMPLASASQDREDTPEERAAKIEQVRKMLVVDPRFKSQTRSASAKYEPAAVALPGARRKKGRRRPKTGRREEGDSSSGSIAPPAAGEGRTTVTAVPSLPPLDTADAAAAAAPKKRRPKPCGKCREPVRGTKVNALGETWHPACFVCSTCQEQLATFFECNGKPFCERHIQAAEEKAFGIVNERGQSLCGKCRLVVEAGTIVTALGKKWHSACFVCATCECALETYFGAAGKPYCDKHVQQAAAPPVTAAAAAAAAAAASSSSVLTGSASSQSTPNANDTPTRRKKKKRPSRPKRALSNPLAVGVKAPERKAPERICRGCALDFASRPGIKEETCVRCGTEKCSSCGTWAGGEGSRVFVCTACLPKWTAENAAAAAVAAPLVRPAKRGSGKGEGAAARASASSQREAASTVSPRVIAESRNRSGSALADSPRKTAGTSARASSSALSVSGSESPPRKYGTVANRSSAGVIVPVIAEESPREGSRRSSSAAIPATQQAALESPHSPRKGSGMFVLSPRTDFSRFPRKQDAVMFLEKSKKRAVRRYAVLQDQVLWFFKDEAAAKKAKDPLEVLDLTRLKKLSRLGVHQEKPFCLAFTVEYDTYVIWTEQLEYSNWAEAIVDSGPPGVVIGTMDE